MLRCNWLQAKKSRELRGNEYRCATSCGNLHALPFCAQSSKRPGRAVFQQTRDQSRVHGVSRPLGDNVAKDVMSGQRQIADQVQHLVAHKLIVEAQRPVKHALPVQNDRTLLGDAADQTHITQHVFVFLKAEGSGWSNLRSVVAGCEVDRESLLANRRWKIDLVGDAVAFARINSNKFVSLADFQGLKNTEIIPAPALRFESNGTKGLNIRRRTSIEDGQLEIVDLYDHIVDAHANQRRQQVLGRLDQHTLTHQACGVADL